MPAIVDTTDKKGLGYFPYQQRQQQRRNHLQKKQRLRKLFELGKLIEKAGLYDEDVAVIYGWLLEAKEKLQTEVEETRRQRWQAKGDFAASNIGI